MRDIPTTFGYGLVKLASQQASIIFFRLFSFFSSAHSLIAGKCLCRVRDMMTTNDGPVE